MNYEYIKKNGTEFADYLRKYFDELEDDTKKVSARKQILELNDLKNIIEEFKSLDLNGELRIFKHNYVPFIEIKDDKFAIYCPEELKDGSRAIAVMDGLGKILLNRKNIYVCNGWKLDKYNFGETTQGYLISKTFSQAFVMPQELFYYFLGIYSTLDDICNVEKLQKEFQVEEKHIMERGKTLGLFSW